MIRKYGGILEHPRHSSLWKEIPLPMPGIIDDFGGFTICIDQFWFGHKARKKTFLYIVGNTEMNLPDIPISFDCVTHYVGYPKSFKGKSKNGMKEITKQEREATPVKLAEWLIKVALICNRG